MARKATQRKPQGPPTWEDLVAKERQQFAMMRDAAVSSPAWGFNVGDTVRYGNLPDCRVEAVEDDGRVYLLSFANTVAKGSRDERAFKEDVVPRWARLACWYDVLPNAAGSTAFGRVSRIGTNYSQRMLESLVSTARHCGLNVTPDFQRDYVWTLEDKRRLIGSIFDRADIGKFITMRHPWPERRITVIDGKQRLDAIMGFMEGRYDYEGMTWPRLSWKDRYVFTDLMVQVCELDAAQCKRSDVLGLFLRVNRGGVPQTDEHIARVRALYEQAVREEAEGKTLPEGE